MMRGTKEEGSSSSSSKLHKPKGASAASSSAAAMVSGGGAAKYLSNLPSRGLFSYSSNAPTNLDRMRVCICEHDTSPPDGQLIKTNQTNILIRALKKQKNDSVSKDAKGKATVENGKGKRAADKPADGRIATKKANTASESRISQPNGSSSRTAEKDFQSLTVERLRAMLKERGMSTKGRKDELIARLKASELTNHS